MASRRISSENSALSQSIAGFATHTGTEEDCGQYASVSVYFESDYAATIQLFTGPSGSLQSEVDVPVLGFTRKKIMIPLAASHYRIDVQNNDASTATATWQTYLSKEHVDPLLPSDASGIGATQPIVSLASGASVDIVGAVVGTPDDYLTTSSAVMLVREANDVRIDELRGRAPGRSVILKFGSNAAIGAGSTEVIWSRGGIYTGWLTTASTVRVKAGGNVNDTSAGTGARTVTVSGLDSTWVDTTETITLAGASASSATTTVFIRINRVYVDTMGTYHGANTGVIVIEDTGTSSELASIEAERGQSEMCIYSVPDGKEAFIRTVSASVDGNKPTDLAFFQTAGADTIAAPFIPKRLIFGITQLTGSVSKAFESYLGPFSARTDLWAEAVGPTGGSAVSANMDIVLVDTV